MSNQSVEKHRGLSVVAVVAVALIIGFGIGVFYSSYYPSKPSSQTSSSQASSSQALSTREYELAFTQEGSCSPPVWVGPWEVVLNNATTMVKPPNATLPLPESYWGGTENQNYSEIWFSVPNGTYTYSVFPRTALHQSGIISMVGSDQVVLVQAATFLCTSQSTV